MLHTSCAAEMIIKIANTITNVYILTSMVAMHDLTDVKVVCLLTRSQPKSV